VHFRGPEHLKQFAVHVHPSASRSEQLAPTRWASLPTASISSPEYILEQLMGQIIPTRIVGMDGRALQGLLGDY
jgi:hypothetical protein